MAGLRQFRLGRSRPHQQLGATFFIVATASVGAIDFKSNLADAIAIFAQLGLNGISALRALGMLRIELLHGLRAMLHFLSEGVELRINFGALVLNRRKFAGQHNA